VVEYRCNSHGEHSSWEQQPPALDLGDYRGAIHSSRKLNSMPSQTGRVAPSVDMLGVANRIKFAKPLGGFARLCPLRSLPRS
jgi:hypothetical protein